MSYINEYSCDFCGNKNISKIDIKKINTRKWLKEEVQFDKYDNFILCSKECRSYFDHWYFGYELCHGLPFYVTNKYQRFDECFSAKPEIIQSKNWILDYYKKCCYNCESVNADLIFLPIHVCFYDCKQYSKYVDGLIECMYFCKNDTCLSNFMLYFDKNGVKDYKEYKMPFILKEFPELAFERVE
jgi:hypothetical protein